MRILVIGGARFLGCHLVDRLMADGDDVVCTNNLYTRNKQDILKWFDCPNSEFIRYDITKPIGLKLDQIYHWACPAFPVYFTMDS